MTSSTPSKTNRPAMPEKVFDHVFGPAFHAVDIGLIVINREGRVVAWNDWMARIARRPVEDVVGKSFYEVFPSARSTRLQSVVEDAFGVGSSSLLTYTLNA